MHNILLEHIVTGYMDRYRRRVDNTIHVSNLMNFCPRQYALCQKLGINYNSGKHVSFGDVFTFSLGDMMHDDIRNVLEGMGILVEREVPIRISKYGVPITGSCDGLTKLKAKKKKIPIEIKSMGNAEAFESLTEPTIDHECQLSSYLWGFEEMKKTDVETDFGLIIYALKVKKNAPVKVFTIKRNQSFIDGVKKKMSQVKTFSVSKKLPDRLCNDVIAHLARQCDLKKRCFEEGGKWVGHNKSVR